LTVGLESVPPSADRHVTPRGDPLPEAEVEGLAVRLRALKLVDRWVARVGGGERRVRQQVIEAEVLGDAQPGLGPDVALGHQAEVLLQSDLDRLIERELHGVVPDLEGGLSRRPSRGGADDDLFGRHRAGRQARERQGQQGPPELP
jgi:hypothetical protein